MRIIVHKPRSTRAVGGGGGGGRERAEMIRHWSQVSTELYNPGANHSAHSDQRAAAIITFWVMSATVT